jgi:hypothetical protein
MTLPQASEKCNEVILKTLMRRGGGEKLAARTTKRDPEGVVMTGEGDVGREVARLVRGVMVAGLIIDYKAPGHEGKGDMGGRGEEDESWRVLFEDEEEMELKVRRIGDGLWWQVNHTW